MGITFRTLLKGTLRDRISLFWAIIFPLVFLFVLGSIFPAQAYHRQLLAGMLALSVLFFGLSGVAFEAFFQRSSGVYKLLRVTPYHTLSFFANLAAARGATALLSCVVVVIAGVFALHVEIAWLSLLLLVPLLLLGVLCFTFLGLIVSNIAQSINQVSILNNIILLPMMFSSETFYSLSSAPAWVRILSRVFPLSYLLDGEHAALAGDALGVVLPLLILAGFTVLALLLTVATFTWDPDVSAQARLRRVA